MKNKYTSGNPPRPGFVRQVLELVGLVSAYCDPVRAFLICYVCHSVVVRKLFCAETPLKSTLLIAGALRKQESTTCTWFCNSLFMHFYPFAVLYVHVRAYVSIHPCSDLYIARMATVIHLPSLPPTPTPRPPHYHRYYQHHPYAFSSSSHYSDGLVVSVRGQGFTLDICSTARTEYDYSIFGVGNADFDRMYACSAWASCFCSHPKELC